MIDYSLISLPAHDSSLTLVKFLLPLHNDALALPATLGMIDSLCYRGALAHEVVAVDDASSDGTVAEARRFAHVMPLWLIQHGRPMGLGQAFRTALESACSDAADGDVLLPIDPRCRPDERAALEAIALARAGWDAVLLPSGRESWRSRREQLSPLVAVYRAGMIKRYLPGFLETAPAAEDAAIRQLQQYLIAAGVRFYRSTAAARQPVLHMRPSEKATGAPMSSRGR